MGKHVEAEAYLDVFCTISLPYVFFRQGLLVSLEFINSLKLADEEAPGSSCLLHHPWYYECAAGPSQILFFFFKYLFSPLNCHLQPPPPTHTHTRQGYVVLAVLELTL